MEFAKLLIGNFELKSNSKNECNNIGENVANQPIYNNECNKQNSSPNERLTYENNSETNFGKLCSDLSDVEEKENEICNKQRNTKILLDHNKIGIKKKLVDDNFSKNDFIEDDENDFDENALVIDEEDDVDFCEGVTVDPVSSTNNEKDEFSEKQRILKQSKIGNPDICDDISLESTLSSVELPNELKRKLACPTESNTESEVSLKKLKTGALDENSFQNSYIKSLLKDKASVEIGSRNVTPSSMTFESILESSNSSGGLSLGEGNSTNKEEFDIAKDVNIQIENEEMLIFHPPSINRIPSKDDTDLTTWLLNKVGLPPFKPSIQIPPGLGLDIPENGHLCESCGDRFFLEKSLQFHVQRRSILIKFKCAPCNSDLKFYNKCSYKNHLREHRLKGEGVDETSVFAGSLPSEEHQLLHPLVTTAKPSEKESDELCDDLNKFGFDENVESAKENVSCSSPSFGDPEVALLSTLLRSPSPMEVSTSASNLEELPGSSKRVKCYLCNEKFGDVRELISHLETNQRSSEHRVKCRKCLLVMPSVCSAKAHILTHPSVKVGKVFICPECGTLCEDPKHFVYHLNTCGHQCRRAGILCGACDVCFFNYTDDFVTHWIREHCAKTYECTKCLNSSESLVHQCPSSSTNFNTFISYLACPICNFGVSFYDRNESEIHSDVWEHLRTSHSSMVNRVHYVFKSKFCINAFRSKDELRVHHDREHLQDGSYQIAKCTIQHEVLGNQSLFFNGKEPRNAFVTLPVVLNRKEVLDIQDRVYPTITSDADMTQYPCPSNSISKIDGFEGSYMKILHSKQFLLLQKEILSEAEEDGESVSLKPCVCYKCGLHYRHMGDASKHVNDCGSVNTPRKCQICGVVAVRNKFVNHCLGHVEKGSFMCIYCNGAKFSSRVQLHEHFKHHAEDQFSYPTLCPFCLKPLDDSEAAMKHMLTSHTASELKKSENVDVKCQRCDRTFHGEHGLAVHSLYCVSTPSDRPNSASSGSVCDVCKKTLTENILGRHTVSHLEKGIMVCGLCDCMRFDSSDNLLRHLEAHAAALKYPTICRLCSTIISDCVEGLAHLKEEHGFGSMGCSFCDMTYSFTSQLQRHIDIVHKVSTFTRRRYICWICQAFEHGKKYKLINHFQAMHGLSSSDIDERSMIRTRGQGSLPSSYFIPFKSSKKKQAIPAPKEQLILKISREKSSGFMVVNAPVAQREPDKAASDLNYEGNQIKLEDIEIKEELMDLMTEFDEAQNISGAPEDKVPDNSQKESEYSKTLASQPLSIALENIKSEIDSTDSDKTLPSTTNKVVIYTSKKDVPIKKSPNTKDGKLKRFKCSQCSFITHSTSELNSHIDTTHDSGRKSDTAHRSEGKTDTTHHSEVKSYTIHRSKGKSDTAHPSKGTTHRSKGKSDTTRSSEGKSDTIHRSKEKSDTSHRNEDEGLVVYKCDHCEERFLVKISLKRHLFFAHQVKVTMHYPQTNPEPDQLMSSELLEEPSSPPKALKPKKSKSKRLIKSAEKESVKLEHKCKICWEFFETADQLHRHLRKHGMSFLSIGRKNRKSISST